MEMKSTASSNRRAFFAELQLMDEDDLAGFDTTISQIDIEAMCAKPLALPRSISGIMTKTVSDSAHGADLGLVEFIWPSTHSEAKNIQGFLKVLEDRLSLRAQEAVDAHRNVKLRGSKSFLSSVELVTLPSLSGIEWTDSERSNAARLILRVQRFLEAYVEIVLGDETGIEALEAYVDRMERQFCGVYHACVRDLLQPLPAFANAIGMSKLFQQALNKEAHGVVGNRRDPIELMEAAAFTQEAVWLYVSSLAAATGGTVKRCRMKHLYRVLEKQTFDPKVAAGKEPSPSMDSSRAMVVFSSMETFVRGLEQIWADHKEGKIRALRLKERFSEPTEGGWSDVLINAQFPTGLVPPLPFEIQLVHVQLLVVRRDMGGHGSYAKYRSAKEILEFHRASVAYKAIQAKEYQRYHQL